MQLNFDGDSSLESKKPSRKHHRPQGFKSGHPSQTTILWGDLSNIVGPTHIARLISEFVDRLNLDPLRETYSGGGALAYDVGMMLKVWLLGYHYGIYTSRPLERHLHESLPFLWISNGQRPDHWTLSDFRRRLQDDIKEVFKGVVQHALMAGAIDGRKVTVDGTIVGANANRHRVLWREWVRKQGTQVEQEINRLAEEINAFGNHEQKIEDEHFGEANSRSELKHPFSDEALEELARKVEGRLKGKRGRSADEKRELACAQKLQRHLQRKTKLAEQSQALNGKKSCARADHDAPVVMDKDGIIRPGYTEMIAAQNGFVVNYETNNIGERTMFGTTVSGCEANTGKCPKEVVADGGFGNEENLFWLEQAGITGFVPFQDFRQERTRAWQNSFHLKDFQVSPDGNHCVCPAGKTLARVNTYPQKTTTGYERKTITYRADTNDCAACNMRTKCTKGKARTLTFSPRYEALKDTMRDRLRKPLGRETMRQRGHDVETVFAERKWNRRNRKFWLRGVKKVAIESGLMYTMINLAKLRRFILSRWGVSRQMAIQA